MKKLLLIALFITGIYAYCNGGVNKDWRFVMPEFEKELQILLEDDIDLQDSSRFINNRGEVRKLWKISHDVYFKNIKNNITSLLSKALNPEYVNISYQSMVTRGWEEGLDSYYSIDEIDGLYYDEDYLKQMIKENYCVVNGGELDNGEIIYLITPPSGGSGVFRYDSEGYGIHVIYDYNQQEVLNLKDSYNNFKNNNHEKTTMTFQSFLKNYDITELQLEVIRGISFIFATPFFNIQINEIVYDDLKDMVEFLLKDKYPYLIDCKLKDRSKNFYKGLMAYDMLDCINIESISEDSLNSIKEIEKVVTKLDKEKIYDKSYAIIIGIDEYQTISDLDYAVNDAVAIKEMLINQFNYAKEDIKLLINEDANKINIEQALSDISLLANENDRIVVFFAGHGETMSLPDGGEMGYLLPVDGRQENLYASAIPMNDLKDLSNISKAKHMLFLVDACYGGLAAVGTRGLTPAKTPNYLEKITNIKARQIITAGGSDEKVIEKPEWGHSAYTMNLLRALKDGLADTNGDGYITAGELGLYLNEKVTIDSDNQQTPQSRRLTSHEGEFIFFNNP